MFVLQAPPFGVQAHIPNPEMMILQMPEQQSRSLLHTLLFGVQVHDPFTQLPWQQLLFALQFPPAGEQHIPLVQAIPFAQPFPQLPQLLESLLRSLQAPLQQADVVPVQTVPHAPQLWISLCSLTLGLAKTQGTAESRCNSLESLTPRGSSRQSFGELVEAGRTHGLLLRIRCRCQECRGRQNSTGCRRTDCKMIRR